MTEAELGMQFGVLQPTVSKVLRHMIPRVVQKLKNHPLARVKFPDEEEMQRYAALITTREPTAERVIGFLDGVSIPIKCSFEDNQRYHSFYHGYTAVNNVFLFSPEGTIIYAAINFPGTCGLTIPFSHPIHGIL
jgi:hypothetical protein